MADAPLAGRKVDEVFADGVAQADADFFRDALDGAFEQVLHARYAGGLALLLVASGGREAAQVLRAARSDEPGYVVLQLTLSDQPMAEPAHPMHRAMRHATPIGSIERPTPDASPIATPLTEIICEHDPNETADHSPLFAGIALVGRGALTPRNHGQEGLRAVRTGQGMTDQASGTAQFARGNLPLKSRQQPSRMQGLGSNGHSRSLTPVMDIPVGGALIAAINQALGVASWPNAPIASLVAAVSPGVI